MGETLFGIDYGSKLTGNTVIAIFQKMKIFFLDVDKGVDADAFILNAADYFSPNKIFIDAPLTLPGVYTKVKGCNDFHFRQADLDLGAMSPMFLGGFAARAIELKTTLEKKSIEIFETYPRILATHFNLKTKGYKGSVLALKDCRDEIVSHFSTSIQLPKNEITTWHHLDALLALMSALNHAQGEGKVYGLKEEGLIYI
tara:strand:+ start:852 stop:1448 length:597 start_codon:yes stop_codon:yes gene_type:complete